MTQPKIEGVGHGVPRMLYASDGSNWYAILVDSDGHVKVDVVSAALGTDGATAANQATMITALQLIDDLRAALGSVNTDDLQVDVKTYPGSNALGNFPFGYYDRYVETAYTLSATAGQNILSCTAVPAGEIWVIQAICATNINKAVRIDIGVNLGGTRVYALSQTMSAANTWLSVAGQWVMKEGDLVSAVFSDCALNDDIYIRTSGYKMKVA